MVWPIARPRRGGEERSSWSSSPQGEPTATAARNRSFRRRTIIVLRRSRRCCDLARTASLSFPRCCNAERRRSTKLRHVGAGSAAAPRAKNSTSPAAFPVEDPHGSLKVVRDSWRRPGCPASPHSVPSPIQIAEWQNARMCGRTHRVVAGLELFGARPTPQRSAPSHRTSSQSRSQRRRDQRKMIDNLLMLY